MSFESVGVIEKPSEKCLSCVPGLKKKWIWFNQCVVNYVVFDLVVRIYSFFYRIFD